MRKSLWSPDEDARLKKYVTQFGHGNWSDVAKYAGLQRCGKSCRLRWLNYLRPDLKRGKFSSDEIRLIVKLHRTLGNSWSKIASCLPGRTDNDIKNFWHSYTRSTRRVILSSSSGSPGDSLRPPADLSNSVVEHHLSDYFSSNVSGRVSRFAASTACHDQDLHRADNAALQYACCLPSRTAHHQSPSHGYAEQQQQQQAQVAHTSSSSMASGSSSTPSPSAVSFRDSAHDAPRPPLLPPHHDPPSRLLSQSPAEDSVMEVGADACTMASLQHPHFDGGSIHSNPSLRPHHQQVPLHYPHDPDPHLLSNSTWDQINEEITDDGLRSVLVNFISHRPLTSHYRFT